MVKAAVGLVTYNNSPEELRAFVRSMENSVQLCSIPMKATLYVIHNGQPVALPEASSHLKIVTIPSAGNVGVGKGMNLLMEEAFLNANDVFMTSNPDGEYHHDFFEQILRLYLESPKSMIEGEQFPEDHPKYFSPDSLETPWASGCAMLIPKALYQAVGGFDEKIFMYMEDVDLSIRVISAGFKIYHAPRALFAHQVLERPGAGASTRKFYLQSALYLAAKYGNLPFYLKNKRRSKEEKIPVKNFFHWRLLNPILYFKYRNYFKHDFYFSKARW
jgi:N-acetylglucosaminyl-diphospho-decaprenol L-rhamnosyltransferase